MRTMTKPLKRDTLARLEKAAMRMVGKDGWLISAFSCKRFETRRNAFEEACSAHAAATAKRGKK